MEERGQGYILDYMKCIQCQKINRGLKLTSQYQSPRHFLASYMYHIIYITDHSTLNLCDIALGKYNVFLSNDQLEANMII